MIDRELCRASGMQYILDELGPLTPFGEELCRRPELYRDADELRAELRRVRTLMEYDGLAAFTRELDRPLMCMKDIRGSLGRCAAGGTLSLLELFEMKGLLLALAEIVPVYRAHGPLEGLTFSDSSPALSLLDPRGERRRSFAIEDAATPVLFELRRRKRDVEAELYKTQDEARRAELRLERESICAGEDAEERAICASLSAGLRPYCAAIAADCAAVGRLDLLLRKAAMGARWGAVTPEIREGDIAFEEMTNPAISASVAEHGGRFVPVSITLSRGAAVITGANMGGKTVALKTLALNVLLAMAGYPVCARAGALPPIGGICFLSGDAERTEKGLSSFGGEVVRLRDALRSHRADSLLLLDEPGRGTNPDEGAAIVRGMVEYLNGCGGFAVVATHYDGVAERAGRHYRIVGLRDMDAEQVKRELAASSMPGPEIIARHMDYGLYPCRPSDACPREALDICRLLGMPEAVMERIERFY